jgi:hypothetical protein
MALRTCLHSCYSLAATSECVLEYMASSSTPTLSYVALFFLDVEVRLTFMAVLFLALLIVGALFLTEG